MRKMIVRQQYLYAICSVLSEKLGKSGWEKDKEKDPTSADLVVMSSYYITTFSWSSSYPSNLLQRPLSVTHITEVVS